MRKIPFLAAALLLSSFCFAQRYIEYESYAHVDDSENESFLPFADVEIQRQADMAAYAAGHADSENSIMKSTSQVNWTKNTFVSDISLDVEKAGIPLPSGKATSIKRIQMELPVLVKDPLLSIYVDDSKTLSDLVLDGSVTLEVLTHIIDNSQKTPAVFAEGGRTLLTKHTIDLKDISSTLVKHKRPYTKHQPIDSIATKEYTGIIFDARGQLPVQGEFVESRVYPCLFPKVWSDKMELIYERNMVESNIVKDIGMVHYSSSEFIESYEDRVGKHPLWITVKKVYGINRCDPIISYEDYLRIASVKENLNLFREGKVVILLDKDLLVHNVSVPDKDKNYYIAYHQMKRYFLENKVPDVVLNDALRGIQITMQNLRFVADSSQLLPEEKNRISQIAASLKDVTKQGGFTIMVEGHTADVKKPEGQMNLSVERARSIIDALVDCGLKRDLFSYRGFGGTKPVADNSTKEGRALNRRVEIIVMPKASYVMQE